MSSNNNFLLKLHMEEEGNTTEIYLNKERRTFTFINDECISDLIIPEFKITSLHMILKNISESEGNDDYYAEYEKDGETVREYDREKIEVLSNLITKIKITDFLDYQKDININEYYVDNIIDAYDCVLPLEMKKILSYTTNGVVFNGDEIYYFMPHDDITSYDGKIKNFIPFMIHGGKGYIGYDYKESLYKEYLNNKLVNDGKTLEEVLNLDEIELIGEEEEDVIEEVAFDDTPEEIVETIEDDNDEVVIEESTDEDLELIDEQFDEKEAGKSVVEEVAEEVIDNEEEIELIGEDETTEDEQLEKIEKEIKAAKEDLQEEIERIEQEYEETIKNIDLQFERLNAGIVHSEKKEEYHFKEKEENVEVTEKVKEPVVVKDDIKEEIRNDVIKSLEEIEKTDDIIDEIDNDMQTVIEKAQKIKTEKTIKEIKARKDYDEIGKEAEEILKKLNDEIASLEEAKQKAKENVKEENIIVEETNEEIEEPTEKTISVSEEILKEAMTILEKLEKEEELKNKSKEVVISDEIGNEAMAILEKLEKEAGEEAPEQTIFISEEIGKEAMAILEKINKEVELVEETEETPNINISEEIRKEAIAILEKLEKEAEERNIVISEEIEEIEEEPTEKTISVSEEILKEAMTILEKLEKEEELKNKSKEVVISDEIGNEAMAILEKLEKEAGEEAPEQTIFISEEIGKEAMAILEKINKEVELVEETEETPNINISEEIRKEAIAILEKLEREAETQNIFISDEIGKEAEMILAKLESEAKQIEEAYEEANAKAVLISEEIGNEAMAILEKLEKEAEMINEIKENASTNKIVISDEIGKEAERILAKLEKEITKVETTKEKSDKDSERIAVAIAKEAERILAKLEKEKENEDRRIAIAEEAQRILDKINSEMEKFDQVKEKAEQKINISEELEKQADIILEKLEKEVREKERLIEEQRLEKERIKEERKKARELKAKQDKEELNNLTNLINSSIYNGFDNYKINFNDTQKLFIEHLPYYEIPTDFSVIQIPEIEYEKLTILPDANINLGRIKLKVEKCNEDSVDFIVQTTSTLVDKDGNKIKKGDIITIKLDEKTDIRLSKKQAMETWSLKLEKSTFEKELRNIDFKKIMSLVIGLESYKKLGNIEKYELQKSLMLFLHFVMENKDFKALDELYAIINKKTDLYEEYITRYNNDHSLAYKDSLRTYEEKKAYLTKLNYINGLIDAKWLDYPRYIYNSHDYFERDEFLDEFLDALNNSLTDHDFYDYLMKLFNEYEMFKDLDEVGKENLDKCIEYLSRLYKYNPELSEDNKYKIEKSFMIGATEEEMALLISKLCRRGIRDYSIFVEYNAEMREKYLMGELKYPVYSEYFEVEEIRNGGEYDEF